MCSKNNVVWLALRMAPEQMEITGIFTQETSAAEVCVDEYDVIGPLTLDEDLTEASGIWPGAYRPKGGALYPEGYPENE